MSDVTQVEVEPQKTAFISRPYSREEKLKQEEEELQELVEEQKQDSQNFLRIFSRLLTER